MFRVRNLVAAVAVSAAVVLITAVPASAHDELVASSPAMDEKLESAPAGVSLSFSDDVLPMGAAVIVVDESGKDWVAGEPVLDEATVTAELKKGMPDAGYELRWRVVSSDGHPISGVIPFTIGAGQPFSDTSAPAAGGADTTNMTDTQAQSAQEDRSAIRIILIGAAGAAIAVAVLLLISFLRRRHAASAQPGGTDTTER